MRGVQSYAYSIYTADGKVNKIKEITSHTLCENTFFWRDPVISFPMKPRYLLHPHGQIHQSEKEEKILAKASAGKKVLFNYRVSLWHAPRSCPLSLCPVADQRLFSSRSGAHLWCPRSRARLNVACVSAEPFRALWEPENYLVTDHFHTPSCTPRTFNVKTEVGSRVYIRFHIRYIS